MTLFPPPTNPSDTILRRMIMATRKRESHPAVNQPAQDTLPPGSSGNSG